MKIIQAGMFGEETRQGISKSERKKTREAILAWLGVEWDHLTQDQKFGVSKLETKYLIHADGSASVKRHHARWESRTQWQSRGGQMQSISGAHRMFAENMAADARGTDTREGDYDPNHTTPSFQVEAVRASEAALEQDDEPR